MGVSQQDCILALFPHFCLLAVSVGSVIELCLCSFTSGMSCWASYFVDAAGNELFCSKEPQQTRWLARLQGSRVEFL